MIMLDYLQALSSCYDCLHVMIKRNSLRQCSTAILWHTLSFKINHQRVNLNLLISWNTNHKSEKTCYQVLASISTFLCKYSWCVTWVELRDFLVQQNSKTEVLDLNYVQVTKISSSSLSTLIRTTCLIAFWRRSVSNTWRTPNSW